VTKNSKLCLYREKLKMINQRVIWRQNSKACCVSERKVQQVELGIVC